MKQVKAKHIKLHTLLTLIQFLEEKLSIFGLNEKESEEFIVYWLPRLEENKYNYIRFVSLDEINRDMPLEITTKPKKLNSNKKDLQL